MHRESLEHAIEDLYRVFAVYPRRSPIPACPCGCDAAVVASVLAEAGPLPELTVDDLRSFSFSALCTVGELVDFKHFLPRLFELNAETDWPYNVEIILGGKLVLGRFRDWPREEQLAVEAYLRALFIQSIATYTGYDRAREALHAFAAGPGDVSWPLARWSEACRASRDARLNLVLFICFGCPQEHPPPFWEELARPWWDIQAWLHDPNTAEVVERAFQGWLATDEGRGWDYRLAAYRDWLRQPLAPQPPTEDASAD